MYKNKNIDIRKAQESDADLYYLWVNDIEVRAQSFITRPVLYEEHIEWFKVRLSDPDSFLYLVECDKVPVGQVRIERRETSVIDISIDKEQRGKGYGEDIIRMGIESYYKEVGSTPPIVAYIKRSNPASIRIFEKAGFRYLRDEIIKSLDCVVLEYKMITRE